MNHEIFECIANYMDFPDKISSVCLTQENYQNIKIKDLKNIPKEFKNKLNNKILQQTKFNELLSLDLNDNIKVTKIDHLITLIELHCVGKSAIDQTQIEKLINLEILNAFNNKKIYDVNKLSKLINLNCAGECGIDQKGIEKLDKLQILCANNNKNIYDVNSLSKTLHTLYCDRKCGITQDGIRELRYIVRMKTSGNHTIHDLNHLSETLRELDCAYSKVNQKGIEKLNLIKLIASLNQYITDVSWMDKMEYLDCDDYCGIGNNGLPNNLVKLNICGNNKFYDINKLKKLKYLTFVYNQLNMSAYKELNLTVIKEQEGIITLMRIN